MSRMDEIEARLKAATPGPWVSMGDTPYFQGQVIQAGPEPMDGITTICETPAMDQRDEDMELIANAPDDLEYLLRVARAAEALMNSPIFSAAAAAMPLVESLHLALEGESR